MKYLTKPIKDKIKRSLLIESELKDKIIKQWSKLSEGQKRAVLQLVDTMDGAQVELLKKAYVVDLNFEYKLKNHINGQQKNKRIKKENSTRSKEEADNILKELNAI